MPIVYAPILKGKEGEYAALKELGEADRGAILPVIEVPPVPVDHHRQAPAKSLDAHLGAIPDRLSDCWPGRAASIDFAALGDYRSVAVQQMLLAVLERCVAFGVPVSPVVWTESTQPYVESVAEHKRRHGLAPTLRLRADDFHEDKDLHEIVESLLGGVSANAHQMDAIIDLGELRGDESTNLMVTRSCLAIMPHASAWRRVIVTSTSFPPDLSDIDAASETLLPRREVGLWAALMRRPERLGGIRAVYGDYGISHPDIVDVDPRKMRMSASIRYTTVDNWLLVKGRNVRQYGFEQYHGLCRQLIERAEYAGPQFSWGDRFIHQCAMETAGPGNATTWRKVGTNHHLVLVSRNLVANSASA